jgi:hypothetical protein
MSQHPPGRGEARLLARHHSRGSGPNPNKHQQQEPAHNGNTILSLVPSRQRVKYGPLNGEAVRVMAGALLDDLLRFSPTTQAEAAVAGRALRQAEAVYQDAKRLANEVAWLNALIADACSGEGAPA